MPEEIKPAEQAPIVEVPKNKEEWSNLAKNDPGRFAELTQTRMDTIFRQNKEHEEKLKASEERERNLLAEVNALKQPKQPVQPAEEPGYGNGKYPQTEEEWNDLFLERPTFANDLRNEFLTKKRTVVTDFENTRSTARKTVQKEHSDMYLPELDETGQPKKDKEGKIILKVDQNIGEPIFNPESEKGKLWIQIFNEDPQGWNSLKNAPQLMMAEMERRLRVKGANMVNGQNNSTETESTSVITPGVTPPKTVSLSFTSDEEKAHAEKAVGRGVYKNLEEYVKERDTPNKGYVEQNRRPDFTRK